MAVATNSIWRSAAVRALERRLRLHGAFPHEPGPDVAECEIRHQVVDRQRQRRLAVDSEEGECARVQLDESPLVVGDQLRDDRLREHRAEDRFRLAALRDVLDERDDVRRSAGLVDERTARLTPDDRPALADVAPLVLPLGAEAGAHLGHIRRVALDVVRVADVTEGHLHQFRDGVAQDLRESFVDLDELPVEARQRHSDRRRAERAAEASLARLQRQACAGDVGDILERDGDAAPRQREGLDREDLALDLVVAVLDLAAVDQRVLVDDALQHLPRRVARAGEHVRETLADQLGVRTSHRLVARRVRVLKNEVVVVGGGPDPERGLHVLDDLRLRTELLCEHATRLEHMRVLEDGADELRHQTRRLDAELVEGVRRARHDREDPVDPAVAVERRGDQRPDADDAAALAVCAVVELDVGAVQCLAERGGLAGEARRQPEPQPHMQ